MGESVNQAAKANLERVITDEQRLVVRRMAWIRLGMSIAAVVATLPVANQPDLRITLFTAVGFCFLSLGILRAITRFPRLGGWAWLATPFLDVPTVAVAQFIQQPKLLLMTDIVPANIGLMMLFIVASSASLSPPVIYATAALGLISMEVTLARTINTQNEGYHFVPMAFVAVATCGIAILSASVVNRFRAMTQAARRRDLVGKYVLGERIGVGGMAEVFSATYSPEGGFERRVAVKKILSSYSQNAESVALFRREAELGAMLAHPNIVQVLDFGTDGDTWFLAMEFIEGVPLSRLLDGLRREDKRIPIGAAVYLMSQLAEALDYIHERTTPTGSPLRLIHRDINPPNILVSRIGEVKLGDFGIARVADHTNLTAAGAVRGKMGYSSPEQLTGRAYDHRADLFSLGVTFHEVLTGKRVFKGESDVTLLMDCLHGDLRPPSVERLEIPFELDRVVMGLLSRELEERTPSAHELARQLAALPPELTDDKAGRHLLGELVIAVQRGYVDPNPPDLATTQPTAIVRPATLA